MREIRSVPCGGVVLAVEYLQNKNSLAVSLSDRTIIFFDVTNMITNTSNTKIDRKLHVPSTQKCLTYVQRLNTLFSAGVDGAIFAWNMDNLFSNEFQEKLLPKPHHNKEDQEEQIMSQKDREKREYINYICEKTPWFAPDFILCLIDLKNINLLATGSYDKNISLWDLRTGQKPAISQHRKHFMSEQDRAKKKKLEEYFGHKLDDDILDNYTKKPQKVLVGH